MTLSKADPADPKNAFALPAINVPDAMLLASAVGLACGGQILISSQWTLPGALAYLDSAIVLFVWNYKNPKRNFVFTDQLHLNPRGEYILLGFMLLLTIGARLFDLDTRVYGLEADETKWTVQSWYSTILFKNVGQFASLHYNYLPVDFWVRSIFLRVFGLNFISARIESAVLSLLAVVFLYSLVRLLTSSVPTGLLSALLFSFSFIELNASHQALHSTPPQAWMLAAFFVLFTALRYRKLWQFQAAGILLALGALTYETFYPNCILALVYLSGMAIFDIKNRRSSVWGWAANLVLTAWPIVAVYLIFAQGYINGRQYYLLGSLQSSIGNGGGLLPGTLQFIWGNFLSVLKVTFSRVIWVDALIYWDGPLVNPLLLPFLVIGLVYNLWNIRKLHFIFIPLLYIFHTFSGPILLGSAWPRVMYLAVPPLIIWGTLGLWISLAALRGIFINIQPRMAVTAFSLSLAFIIGNDYFIFSNRLIDPEERQKRRELADLTMSTAKDISSLILLPYMAHQNDTVELEDHIFPFSIAGARNLGLDAVDHYKQIDMNLLLSELWLLKENDGLDVIFDKTAPEFREEREKSLSVVLDCYTQADITHKGRFFDVYHFDRQALQSPQCHGSPLPLNVTPKDGLPLSDTKRPTFQWNTTDITTTGFSFNLQRKHKDVFWIEIEEKFQGEGWMSENGFVLDYNGTGFLLDDWQAEETRYSFESPQTDKYRVWVRYYKRINNDQRNFINVNKQVSEFAKNGTLLNKWMWASIGSYDFPTGSIPISFTRTYGADGQYSIFMDTIVITSNINFRPNIEKDAWQDILSTGEINSNANYYTLTENLSPGEYRWSVRIFDGNTLIDSTGSRGVESVPTYFTVP